MKVEAADDDHDAGCVHLPDAVKTDPVDAVPTAKQEDEREVENSSDQDKQIPRNPRIWGQARPCHQVLRITNILIQVCRFDLFMLQHPVNHKFE